MATAAAVALMVFVFVHFRSLSAFSDIYSVVLVFFADMRCPSGVCEDRHAPVLAGHCLLFIEISRRIAKSLKGKTLHLFVCSSFAGRREPFPFG